MGLALDEARSALGSTAPNPSVGAVIVRDDSVLGQGHTQPVGGPHAEVEAIQAALAAGHSLENATLYVTLEPCCHWGRTPPCTDLIIKHGIGRVVVGIEDPFPPMQGKGLARLQAHGVEVLQGVRQDEAADIVLGFTRTVVRGMPEVTAKVAMSIDGNIATSTGESKWITGESARADGHQLRKEHDAILVGIGTVVADDPQLNCRLKGGTDPIPVILDSQLRIDLTARVLHAGATPLVVCADDAPHRQIPADVLRVPRGPNGRLDLERALKMLAARGLHRVLVEGGAQVHGSFFEQRMVDTLHLYIGSTVIPGGKSWLSSSPIQGMAEAWRLSGPPSARALGDDIRLTWSRLRAPDRDPM